MRKLALDQALNTSGFAIGDGIPGKNKSVIVESGIIETRKEDDMINKLIMLYHDLNDLVRDYQPDLIVFEQHHFHALFKPDDILAMAGAAVMVMFVARINGIPFERILQQSWKAPLGVKSKKSDKEYVKREVKHFVCQFYDIPPRDIRTYDQSDALGMLAAHDCLFGSE